MLNLPCPLNFPLFLKKKSYTPPGNIPFVSTNFYLNNTWHLDEPNDDTTWVGVTRRNNLQKLANQGSQHDIRSMMSMMDRKIEDGGAVWENTIYQIIFHPLENILYLKVTQHHSNWTAIPLNRFFMNNLFTYF